MPRDVAADIPPEAPAFHPEYPAAHAFHSSAVAETLRAFFGTDNVSFSLDSRVTGTTREYQRFHDAVQDVMLARTLAGFHFRNSCEQVSVARRENVKKRGTIVAIIHGRFLRFEKLLPQNGAIPRNAARMLKDRNT
jgi:hypothetical protein